MIRVEVFLAEDSAEGAAEVLRLIAGQLEDGFTSGFDRRDGGEYRYAVEDVPPPVCRYCRHSWAAHHEDGPDEPGTACADPGPQNQGCLCGGYVGGVAS